MFFDFWRITTTSCNFFKTFARIKCKSTSYTSSHRQFQKQIPIISQSSKMASFSYTFHIIFVPAFLFINFIASMADNTTSNLEFDRRTLIRHGSFQGQGYISISLSSVRLTTNFSSSSTNPNFNLTRIGFFLAESLPVVNNQSCTIEDQNVIPIVTFSDLPSPVNPQSSIKRTVEIKDRKNYHILYRNYLENTLVSLIASIDTYDRETKAYGDYICKYFAVLPKVMLVSSVLSGVLLVIWGFYCYRNPRYLHMIHYLLSALLALKLFKCLCGMAPQRPLPEIMNSTVGELSLLIHFMYYGSGIALLFMPMTSLLKSCLRKREEEALMVFLVLQIIADLLHMFKVTKSVKLYTEYPYDRFLDRWDYAYIAVGVLISFFMVLSFVIVTLRLQKEATTGQNAVKNLEKWKILMVVYLVFTLHQLILRICVFVFRMKTDYDEWWITLVVEQLVRFLFMVFLYYVFRPCLRNERSLWGNQQVPALPAHDAQVYPLQDYDDQ